MLTIRGGAVALLLAVVGLFTLGTPDAGAQPAGVAITVDMKLNRQGVLEVDERVTVPPDGRFQMSLPLRLRIDENSERRFQVTDIEASGAGTAQVVDDLFTVDAGPGESTFRYAVHNTVNDAEGSQVFRWMGALNADIAEIHASLISPSFEMGIVDCKLGPPGNTRPCAQVRIEADGMLYLEQTNLRKGEAVDLTLQIPPGTVPANADIHSSGGSFFALTGPVFLAFGVLLAAMAALAAYIVRARRPITIETIDPLVHADGRTQFASPDGLLPGEAGLLLNEYAAPTDIAATVVDLAVRCYIRIEPIGDSDWRITRINPPDDGLRGYERALYDTLLPAGTEATTLSELRRPGRMPVESLRAAMFADAVERGVLFGTGRRRLPLWLGGGLLVVGIAATIGAAVVSGHVLVGIAIALGGLGVLVAQRFLPSRTGLGRELTAQVHGLRRGLDELRADRVPAADRELVFSRALPYTVVWGRADNWIRAFRDLDPAADNTPGLYWFGGFDRDRDLHRFAGHFPYFITAVESLFPAA
ncbi:DUF2207 family protein [Nocardia paucivorans]|uniref:DUF2207 family protein n=1 Tax=Nocardia paucivorans TaxID=114259 RepID=UPI0002E7EFBA|nr:DUF2207 domain-containing protein [Nocardia paucivorans]